MVGRLSETIKKSKTYSQEIGLGKRKWIRVFSSSHT